MKQSGLTGVVSCSTSSIVEARVASRKLTLRQMFGHETTDVRRSLPLQLLGQCHSWNPWKSYIEIIHMVNLRLGEFGELLSYSFCLTLFNIKTDRSTFDTSCKATRVVAVQLYIWQRVMFTLSMGRAICPILIGKWFATFKQNSIRQQAARSGFFSSQQFKVISSHRFRMIQISLPNFMPPMLFGDFSDPGRHMHANFVLQKCAWAERMPSVEFEVSKRCGSSKHGPTWSNCWGVQLLPATGIDFIVKGMEADSKLKKS